MQREREEETEEVKEGVQRQMTTRRTQVGPQTDQDKKAQGK